MKENQPKHRQLRKEQRKLERRKAYRAGAPAILIVCEGRETEPNYIRGLCEAHRVNLASIKLCPGTNAGDVVSLVTRAQEIFAEDSDFDRIYVVCDHDGQSFEEAVRIARKPLLNSNGERIAVTIIRSWPCFEFWLLLHFEYSSRPYRNAREVIADLRKHVTDYDKAHPRIFQQVQSGLDHALGNAQKLKRELEGSGARAPDSDMHELVKQLLSMRRLG